MSPQDIDAGETRQSGHGEVEEGEGEGEVEEGEGKKEVDGEDDGEGRRVKKKERKSRQ